MNEARLYTYTDPASHLRNRLFSFSRQPYWSKSLRFFEISFAIFAVFISLNFPRHFQLVFSPEWVDERESTSGNSRRESGKKISKVCSDPVCLFWEAVIASSYHLCAFLTSWFVELFRKYGKIEHLDFRTNKEREPFAFIDYSDSR